MKFALFLLLISTLALAPAGCNRGDESVTADSGNPADKAAAPAATDKAPEDSARRSASPRPAEREADTPAAQPDRPAVRESARNVEPAARPAAPIERDQQTATVPSGSALTVVLIDAISTESNAKGDTFNATLAEALTVNGKVVADRGSRVVGRVANLDEPGKVKGRARLELELTQLTVGGKRYNLDSEPFVAVASDNKERDAAVIAGGAGVGAVIGGIAKGKKGAAIGAIIGGGTGTTAVLMSKGEQLTLPSESRVNFVLKNSLTLPVIRPTS